LREDANDGHAEILDALERRDVEAAIKALDEHLRTSIDAFDAAE
jgi:DNA-binding GntR family transcriptional regulator